MECLALGLGAMGLDDAPPPHPHQHLSQPPPPLPPQEPEQPSVAVRAPPADGRGFVPLGGGGRAPAAQPDMRALLNGRSVTGGSVASSQEISKLINGQPGGNHGRRNGDLGPTVTRSLQMR